MLNDDVHKEHRGDDTQSLSDDGGHECNGTPMTPDSALKSPSNTERQQGPDVPSALPPKVSEEEKLRADLRDLSATFKTEFESLKQPPTMEGEQHTDKLIRREGIP